MSGTKLKNLFMTHFCISECERTRPLTDNECELIRKCFKEQYQKPMYAWAITARQSKKDKLFRLLNGSSIPSKTRKPVAPFQKHIPEFILRSGNYVVDLNRSFKGPNDTKELDARHYVTGMKTSELFHYSCQRPQTVAETNNDSLALFYAKKIFNPSFAEEIAGNANESIEFLQELVDYVETKAHYYPVDPMRDTPELRPSNEGKIIAGALKEDHIHNPTFARHEDPFKLLLERSKHDGTAKMLSKSNYQENFTREPFNNLVKTRSIKPIINPIPFSQYPVVEPVPFVVTREQYMEQSNLNKMMGRKNRECFTSKTCL